MKQIGPLEIHIIWRWQWEWLDRGNVVTIAMPVIVLRWHRY